MTWVIELDVDEVNAGPGHGELLAVVDQALRDHAPDLVKTIRVRWQDDVDLDRAVERLTGQLVRDALWTSETRQNDVIERDAALLHALVAVRDNHTYRKDT